MTVTKKNLSETMRLEEKKVQSIVRLCPITLLLAVRCLPSGRLEL